MRRMALLAGSVISLVIVLAVVGYAAQNPDGPPLSVELNVFELPGTDEVGENVLLLNEGEEPITVFTKSMNHSMSQPLVEKKKGKRPIRLQLGKSKVTWQEHELVTSKHHYAPVQLQPGQATVYQFSEPIGDPLNELDDGAKRVRVGYTVTAEMGERYDVWSGSATSEWYKVKDGRIQPKE